MTDVFRPFDLVSDATRIGELQGPALVATMARISRTHPHYRDLMRREGIRPAQVTSVSDLDVFPLTDKAELVAAPERFRLEPDPARPEQYAIWDVAYTTGTALGRSTPIYQTAHDFRALTFAQRRMAEIRGMGSGGRIVNLYPITPLPHGAWLRCNHAAAAIGASVTSGMSGRRVDGYPVVRDTDEVVAITVRANPTVLWGVPSYVRRILQEVVATDGRLPSLRMIAVSGEPCGGAMRASLLRLAGEAGAETDVVVSDSMGATELQCGLVECVTGAGFHNPAPELFHLAAVDDAGIPVGDGEVGRLVLTHLDRRGTVLVRFALGDVVRFTDDACDHCGRGGGRVTHHLGRDGSFMKIRGNLVDMGALSNAVGDLPRVIEHQFIIQPPSSDSLGLEELVVRVVTDADACDEVAREVGAAVGRTANMQPLVECVDIDAIWSEGPHMKPRRIVDRRPHG